MRLTKDDSAIIGAYDYVDGLESLDPIVDKCGQLEDLEESTNIPFSKISSLKAGDIVYFKRVTFSEGKIFNINYENLTITILDKEGTFIDFMLFHQYGKNRNTPLHCWFGAWALTKEELL